MPIDDELFGMPPLDLGEAMGPQAPPQSAPTARARAKEYAPLLALLPIVAAKGGRVGIAALLQGFQQARMQDAQTERQKALDAERQRQTSEAERMRRATLAQNTANDAAMRRNQFMQTFQTGLASDALDSPEAVRAFMDLYRPQAESVGVRPDALDAITMEAMTPSRLQTKAAKKAIADLQKNYPNDFFNMSVRLPGEELPVPYAELTRRAGYEGAPSAPKANDKRGFTSKDITFNGRRMLANFDPDTGEYFAIGDNKNPLRGDIQEYNKPAAPTGADRPLTQNQRANVISSRRTQWTRLSKAVSDREGAIAKVDAGVAALKRGNRNAATQAIIMGFNKLLDETSVVREGEYARSEQLVSLVGRIEGALQRVVYGGASMPDSELVGLANEAKQIAASMRGISEEAASNLRQAISEELDDYTIPHSRVFGGSTLGVKKPKASAPPGGNPFRRGNAGSGR